jgi:hypothetical protein
MYFLTTISKLYEPFNLELVSRTSSRLNIGFIAAIGLENKGFGIIDFPNYFILSFKNKIYFSMSSMDSFKACPVAS